jgi:hypothetical protein
VFACTCKKTNPKANPKRVITQQHAATLIISAIIFINLYLFYFFRNRFYPKQLELKKKKKPTLKKPILN